MAAGLCAAVLSGCGAPVAARPAAPSDSSSSSSAPPPHSSASAASSSTAKGHHPSTAQGGGSTTTNKAVRRKAKPVAAKPAPQRTAAPVMPEAVVIGNDPNARPQAGLHSASVVWEILAEGWITRYLAIFAQQASPKIGPVRSARIYFDQLAGAYGVPFAHAGGNVDALNNIGRLHIQNLDQIYGSAAYFWRGASRTPPDNLYTSTALLNAAARNRHFHRPLSPYPASGVLAAGGKRTASVRLNYLTDPPVYTYVAGWTWSGGWWYRNINGVPARVQNGAAIRAGSVIILVARQAPDPDPYTPGALKILWQDGGTAWVLRGGVRLRGTWRMGSHGLPVVYAAGGHILAAGHRAPYWYEVVPSAADVSFAP